MSQLRKHLSMAAFWGMLFFCIGHSELHDRGAPWPVETAEIPFSIDSTNTTVSFTVTGWTTEDDVADSIDIGAKVVVTPGAVANFRMRVLTEVGELAWEDVHQLDGKPVEPLTIEAPDDCALTCNTTRKIELVYDGGTGALTGTLSGVAIAYVNEHGGEDHDPGVHVEMTQP